MYTLPTQKKFRKKSRIKNLQTQTTMFQNLTGVLAQIARAYYQGLTELRESYLEAPIGDADPNGLVEQEYVWNGEKPAPEMILDIAERVENIFKEAGLNPSVFQHAKQPAQQAVDTNCDQQKDSAPPSFKV